MVPRCCGWLAEWSWPGINADIGILAPLMSLDRNAPPKANSRGKLLWSEVRLEVTCNKDRGKRESALPSLPFILLFKPITVARSLSSTLSFGCGFLAHTPAGPADQASVCCNGASAALRHGPFGLLFKHRLMPLISVGVALQACLPIWSELCVNF